MLLRVINLLLISTGMLIMVLATIRYHKLLRYNRQSIYDAHKNGDRSHWPITALMYLFIFGFVVGLADTLLSTALAPIYTFIAAIFFFGAGFIYVSVNAQISMNLLLRQKNVEIMKTFVNAIDLKDAYTKGHSEHVYHLVQLLCEQLPDDLLAGINMPKLLDAAMLHDCGKISISDDVLNKPEKLSPQDWEIIRTHPVQGKKMLDDTCYHEISDWVLYHHERIDGKGYYRLPGGDIPLESRIIAIADTYSALSTDRVYRQRFEHARAIEIMVMAAGTQLDSTLMGCFMKIPPESLRKVQPNVKEPLAGAHTVLVEGPGTDSVAAERGTTRFQ